ncbi:MAG: 2,3-diaminopropionate biosynthesis protein SbnA [Hyphomicrobiaceae bacterium]
MIVESPLELIFRDLFYRLRGFAGGHDVFLKLEGFNVTGSIKVKTAIGLIEDLEKRGLARPHETVIIESSSGNLGIALSMVCAIKGYRFICVTDSNATRANIRGMKLYGAEVIVVADRDVGGGFLENRFKIINRLLATERNSIWLNQYDNLANKQVHADQTASEIVRNFAKVDWIFIGAGTTGTLGGVSEVLRETYPNVCVVAVEPQGSVTFGGKPGTRNIPGIGTSLKPKISEHANPDKVVAIDEAATVESCLDFVRDYHLLIGGSTGTVLAAIKGMASEFRPGDTIVAISADLGEKYMDTVYDPDWVREHIMRGAKVMADS